MTALLLHGFEGSGPEHWQTWLARRLAEQRHDVRYPELPDPCAPSLEAWLAVLEVELATVGSSLTVLGHSCGASLWLHHLARGGRPAERTVLVAPPGPHWSVPEVHGFMPIPLPPVADGILVAGDDDPYCSAEEAQAYATTIGVPLALIPGGGHLHTAAGYGPWPVLERWCVGQGAAIDLAALLAQSSTSPG